MLHALRGLGSPLGGMELPGCDRGPASVDNAEVGESFGSSRHCFLPWVSLFLGAKFVYAVRSLAVIFPWCPATRSDFQYLWRKHDSLRVKSSLQLEVIGFTEKKRCSHRRRQSWWQNSPATVVVTSNGISINMLQWILCPPAKRCSDRMSGHTLRWFC